MRNTSCRYPVHGKAKHFRAPSLITKGIYASLIFKVCFPSSPASESASPFASFARAEKSAHGGSYAADEKRTDPERAGPINWGSNETAGCSAVCHSVGSPRGTTQK